METVRAHRRLAIAGLSRSASVSAGGFARALMLARRLIDVAQVTKSLAEASSRRAAGGGVIQSRSVKNRMFFPGWHPLPPHPAAAPGLSGQFHSENSSRVDARGNYSANVNNEAFPPAAVVLMVNVRSLANFSR